MIFNGIAFPLIQRQHRGSNKIAKSINTTTTDTFLMSCSNDDTKKGSTTIKISPRLPLEAEQIEEYELVEKALLL